MRQLAEISHSQSILNLLREYDSFLDGLKHIADMGCGSGSDIDWWANLKTRDEPPVPYNYNCYAVDIDNTKLAMLPKRANLHKICKDFTKPAVFPTKVDLIFCHNAFQYSFSPIDTLRLWNSFMNVNGMLIISVKQQTGIEYNKYYSRTYSGSFFSHTPTNLIYMLAVNGFDCNDAYLLKKFNDPWINIAVYKSDIPPMDPQTTNWETLAETGLLHPSVVASIVRNGHVRQEEIVYPWLDKENYFIDYVMPPTEIPIEAGEPKVSGVFNNEIQSLESTVSQGKKVIKHTELLSPTGVLKPPKIPFKK